MQQNQPYETEYEYETYDEYPDDTSLGLPPSQLALIIGVNAVISLLISVSVVLIVNWQVNPTTTAAQPTATLGVTGGEGQPIAIGQGDVTAPPTPEIVIYRVQRGDALSSIAAKFNVPIFDLMVANGLTNEDFIQVDQELIIPIGGLPTATPTFTPIPSTPTEVIAFDPPTPLPGTVELPQEPVTSLDPTLTPLAPTPVPVETTPPTATPPPPTGVLIEISEVVAAGDLANERLVLTNLGIGTSMKDWTLEGSPIGTFSFPDIFIFSGGTIRIHTQAGQSTPSDLYLNQTQAAWPVGSTITLRSDGGALVTQFTVE